MNIGTEADFGNQVKTVKTEVEACCAQDSISSALVRGLQTCPDAVPMRRELLIATRHVLTTAVRTGALVQGCTCALITVTSGALRAHCHIRCSQGPPTSAAMSVFVHLLKPAPLSFLPCLHALSPSCRACRYAFPVPSGLQVLC